MMRALISGGSMLSSGGCMAGGSRVTQLFCLLDGGRLDSSGQLITASGESFEIAFCKFDLAISGFRRTDQGWVPVFVHQHDRTHRTSGVTLVADESATGSGPRYTEADIAAALRTFRST